MRIDWKAWAELHLDELAERALEDSADYVAAHCPSCGRRRLLAPNVLTEAGSPSVVTAMVCEKCGWSYTPKPTPEQSPPGFPAPPVDFESIERAADLAHDEAVRLHGLASEDPLYIRNSAGAQKVEGMLRGLAHLKQWPEPKPKA
jgi:predicted RNA-binding Zn-ribbon protein involved in translation (DUF1610 family)